MQAIKDYENNKWKVIGQKVGKPAKVRNPVFLSFSPLSLAPDLCSGQNRTTSRPRSRRRSRYTPTSRFDLNHGLLWTTCRTLIRPEQQSVTHGKNQPPAYLPLRQADSLAELISLHGRPSNPLRAYTAGEIPTTWPCPPRLPAFLFSPHFHPHPPPTHTISNKSPLNSNGDFRSNMLAKGQKQAMDNIEP